MSEFVFNLLLDAIVWLFAKLVLGLAMAAAWTARGVLYVCGLAPDETDLTPDDTRQGQAPSAGPR